MKTQKSFYEQSGGTYTQVGDVLIPNLTFGEDEKRSVDGKGRRTGPAHQRMTRTKGVIGLRYTAVAVWRRCHVSGICLALNLPT